jgi:hypothetical protein
MIAGVWWIQLRAPEIEDRRKTVRRLLVTTGILIAAVVLGFTLPPWLMSYHRPLTIPEPWHLAFSIVLFAWILIIGSTSIYYRLHPLPGWRERRAWWKSFPMAPRWVDRAWWATLGVMSVNAFLVR